MTCIPCGRRRGGYKDNDSSLQFCNHCKQPVVKVTKQENGNMIIVYKCIGCGMEVSV